MAEETILEKFDCLVDAIYDGVAYVSITAPDGEELEGTYSADKLAALGIGEGNRFLAETVKTSFGVDVRISAVSQVELTQEQIDQIMREIDEALPDDPSVDY